MKNERPQTQQNLLKRERYRPVHRQLHQIPNWGVAICTGIQHTILPQTRGSLHAPPQRIPQGWKGGSPEGGEGGIRKSRRPHSLVPPQGAIKSPRTTWYSNTGEARKNNPSQTSFPYKKPKEISRLQVISSRNRNVHSPNKFGGAARLGTGCQGILVPAARNIRRLQVPHRAIGTSPDNEAARDKSRSKNHCFFRHGMLYYIHLIVIDKMPYISA